MEWKVTQKLMTELSADAIVAFHCEGEALEGTAQAVDESLGKKLSLLLADGEIKGKYEEITVVHTWGEIPAKRVVVLGLGKKRELDLLRLRHVVGRAARRVQEMGAVEIGLSCPLSFFPDTDPAELVQAMVEGFEIGLYQPRTYKKEQSVPKLNRVWLSHHLLPESAVEQGVQRGQTFAEATNLARELTDLPANKLTPALFAEQAQEVAKRAGLAIDIYEEAELKRMGMHTFLAVAKGSTEPPKLVVLTHQGAPESKEVLGLVGKGVTFDSGGLQIKPDTSMEDMKTDMGGAAAVLGAMEAIGRLQVKANVIGVIPLCENMADGNAMRPGDVIPSFSGKTIEITHTDAEGRLILADALSFARSLGVTRLVDIATLTGAAIVALGHETTALMTNNANWASQVFRAAEQVGERMWELPLFPEYDALLESEWADVKNDNGRPAGAIQGGLFLKHFVEDTPWVHLDIAGTVDVRKEKGMYRPGATGVGVRTMIQLALNGVNAGETDTSLRTPGVLSQSAGK